MCTCIGETLRAGPQPQVAVPQTNNHQSGFKRQNTVDSATIKENSRLIAQRPASAQPKPPTENSKSVKQKPKIDLDRQESVSTLFVYFLFIFIISTQLRIKYANYFN